MSTNIKHTRPLSSVLAACALAIAATAFVSAPSSTLANDAEPHASTHHSAQMDHSKMSGMDGKTMHNMSMTGDVDYDFAANMRMHHKVAVDMSQKELDKGTNSQLKQMAKDIIAAQKKEIATLDKWLATNKANAKAK
jgi:uncharacterized protein (DUF305 family)